MQYHSVMLNPLLKSSLSGTAPLPLVRIDWDIRRPPNLAACVEGHTNSPHHLTQLATRPAVTDLRIISDLLMEDWMISVHNPTGVTIGDVLCEIHRGLRAPLLPHEWEYMAPAQRTRVENVFYERCKASRDFNRTRYGGVRRMDCLLHTTVFAGLTSLVFRNNRWEVVLTLSRDFGAHSRARGLPEV